MQELEYRLILSAEYTDKILKECNIYKNQVYTITEKLINSILSNLGCSWSDLLDIDILKIKEKIEE